MTGIVFLLNGSVVTLEASSPTTTLLDWLREYALLRGTKEGCNEGDCGACTVMVSALDTSETLQPVALNACILFLPQLHLKAIRTIEGVQHNDTSLHQVQQAMIDEHASQCGFCTPGFVMSLISYRESHDTPQPVNDVIAGNLCRCTGYASIVKAANSFQKGKTPEWLKEDQEKLRALQKNYKNTQSLNEFSQWYWENPDATLVAGATDVGLWVTKKIQDIPKIAFLNRLAELYNITQSEESYWLGAMVNWNRVRDTLSEEYPSFSELIRRFASYQIRNAATIGGNIANGSPIGDGPPPLIALGAELHLMSKQGVRTMPLEAYFLDYGKQDRRRGEFVLGVRIPKGLLSLGVYKLSKRFDQDISAVCGAFLITCLEGKITDARIAFGGMAAIPKRAVALEKSLIGKPWSLATIKQSLTMIDVDFQPISDMRASAVYRQETAKNMLLRYFYEQEGVDYARDVLRVSA